MADTIIVACRMLSIVSQSTYEVVQWLCHFCQVSHEGWPVVLFQIDVNSIVASPWRPQVWCP